MSNGHDASFRNAFTLPHRTYKGEFDYVPCLWF